MSTRLLFLDIDGVMHSVDRVQAPYPGIVWGSEIPTPELARRVIWCDPVLGLATPLVAAAIVRRFIDDRGC